MQPNTKSCSTCHEIKPATLDNFYKIPRLNLDSRCKVCRGMTLRKYEKLPEEDKHKYANLINTKCYSNKNYVKKPTGLNRLPVGIRDELIEMLKNDDEYAPKKRKYYKTIKEKLDPNNEHTFFNIDNMRHWRLKL